MSRLPVSFHPEAMEEAEAAAAWYLDRSKQAADAFVRELERAIEKLADAPGRWPIFEGETRRFTLRRFPFLVVYRASHSAIEVLAVAHGRRRPGYWRNRVAGRI